MNVYRESRDVPTQQMLTFAGGGGACHMWLSSKFETWYFSPRLHYVMSCENQNSNSMKFLTFLTQLFRSVSNDYEMKTKLLVMCAFSSVQINAKMVFFRYAAICAAHPFINYVNDDALYSRRSDAASVHQCLFALQEADCIARSVNELWRHRWRVW